MYFALLLIVAYLIGSIPTSIIAGKVTRGIDIREHGSGNPGATNTFRVLGKKIGITVGLIDIFKGFFAVFFLPSLMPGDTFASEDIRRLSAGLAAVAGHMWTVFAGFRGGKGVGTSFGVIIGLVPLASVVTLAAWCILTFSTGYVSLGSIVAAAVLPVAIVVEGILGDGFSVPVLVVATVLALLVIFRHRSNIGRLFRGEENRFGKRGAS